MDIQALGIILSLFLLILFAYKGYSVIMFAPIFALLAAFSQGFSILPSYTELFMAKAVVYIKSFFPVFILGAIFGKVMEDTGLAKSIASAIIKKIGTGKAILAVVLACVVLTYGGVLLFVVVFAVYPFAAALFKEARIPKRLIPGAIALGAFTFTMDAAPGTPQIQNLIPTKFFGTTLYAAPICGMIGGLFILCVGMFWLEYRRKSAQEKGEEYGENHINEPILNPTQEANLVDWRLATLPLFTVLVVNFIMTSYPWSESTMIPFQALKLPLLSVSVKSVASIWALICGLVAGIIAAILVGRKSFSKESAINKGHHTLQNTLNAGAIGSLLAIMNTASEVGYGNVIAALPGFHEIAAALLSIHVGSSPLFSEAVTVNVLAGITGSASGGMSIALDLMGQDWLTWANSIGMSPEILHRVASMASGGMDTLPHNGAVITLLAVSGLTHRESYGDIFAMTCIKTITCFLVIGFHLLTGFL